MLPGSKPLPEPMLTEFCDAIWYHQGSVSLEHITVREMFHYLLEGAPNGVSVLFNEVERVVYWFHIVRPSGCPSVHLSVDGIVSAL